MRFILFFAVFLMFFLPAGCKDTATDPAPVPTEVSSSTPTETAIDSPHRENEVSLSREDLVSAQSNFGFKLYSALLETNKGKNLFISPSSIAIALSMTYNGAEGETKEAMAKTLELSGLSLEGINQASMELLRALETEDEKIELSIANSLWCNPTIKFKEDFIKRCQDFYSAEIRNEFDAGVINGWISEKTRGKITNVIQEVPPEAILYLINAIYFKGKWSCEFDKERTQDREFHLPDGSKKMHPMMSQGGNFNYYRGDKFQAVSLPYGEGKYSMYVFLPDGDSSLEEFHTELSAENWGTWMKGFHMMEGDIIMPRFKFEYSVILNSFLSSMGMENAFSEESADFNGMCYIPSDSNVYISKVIHKTFVEVNEEGTEAAAVTVVEIGLATTSVDSPRERFYMLVDRPFFFCIRDNETGTILFMGSIVEPAE